MATQKKITSAQSKLIHTLLSKNDLMQHKAVLCHSFSNGRTEHSSELTLDEAKSFITYLKNSDEGTSYVKRIFHLAYLSDIIYGDTDEDKAMNTAKLNSFLEQRGTVKKPLHQQNIKELKRTVRQLEAILDKTSIKKAVQKSTEILTKWIDEWVKREEYEKAQVCKNYIDRIKTDPKFAFSVLEFDKNRMVIN